MLDKLAPPAEETARETTEARDILNSGAPFPVMRIAHRLITDEVKRLTSRCRSMRSSGDDWRSASRCEISA